MSTLRTGLAALLSLPVLTGCGAGGDAPVAPQPPATSVAGSADVLGPKGYQDLELGQTFQEAMATGKVTKEEGGEGFGYALTGHASTTFCLTPEGGLMAILSSDPALQTPEGIGVGSTRAEVLGAYPKAAGYPEGPAAKAGIVKVALGDHRLYEIDLEKDQVSMVILRLEAQTCFE